MWIDSRKSICLNFNENYIKRAHTLHTQNDTLGTSERLSAMYRFDVGNCHHHNLPVLHINRTNVRFNERVLAPKVHIALTLWCWISYFHLLTYLLPLLSHAGHPNKLNSYVTIIRRTVLAKKIRNRWAIANGKSVRTYVRPRQTSQRPTNTNTLTFSRRGCTTKNFGMPRLRHATNKQRSIQQNRI